MIIDKLQVGDIFTDNVKSKVTVTSIEQDGNKVRCNLRRVEEGPYKGTSYISFFKITPDGKIDLKDCTDFIARR